MNSLPPRFAAAAFGLSDAAPPLPVQVLSVATCAAKLVKAFFPVPIPTLSEEGEASVRGLLDIVSHKSSAEQLCLRAGRL